MNLADYQLKIDDGQFVAQVQKWFTPNQELNEADWKAQGYETLAAYLQAIVNEGLQGLSKIQQETIKHMPVLSLGFFDPKTGQKKLWKVYKTLEDLPDAEGFTSKGIKIRNNDIKKSLNKKENVDIPTI